MLFSRHKPTRLHPVNSSESLVGTNRQPPKTLEDILAASMKPTDQGPPVLFKSSHSSNLSRSRCSSDHRLDLERERAPQSRKTGYATIHTDATEEHAAFESDAFAIHMPTTRVPIIASAGRTVRPSPAAQAEAYRTYMEKARQVRERNKSHGSYVPSKLVSHSHASQRAINSGTPEVNTVGQPTCAPTPAGSFPTSPPLPQHAWPTPEQRHRMLVQGPRAMKRTNKPQTPPKLVNLEKHVAMPSTRYQYHADSAAGASSSTGSPTKHTATIKVRLIPKLTMQEIDRVQTESRYSLYSSPSPPSSRNTSRSSSPSKSMPNFIGCDSLEGDSIFGYRVKDITGTVAGASSTSGSDREKKRSGRAANSKKASPKRATTSRWAWLKPSTPRLTKPPVSPTAATAPDYNDPFITHATPLPTPTIFRSPAASRPASPKKLHRLTPPTSAGKFDSGFAQIKRLALFLFKIALSLYAVVALWFVLDAVRQAIYTLGAPFRVIKSVGATAWIWGSWLFTMMVKMWEKWGFKVALKGGWMWKMKW